MPDWGIQLPTVFLTQASMELIGHEDYDRARSRLCEGKDVAIALITGDRAERFRQWQTRLKWTAQPVVEYRHRDGTVYFELATFDGSNASERCP